ncbi:hypothetical protein ACLOJK_032129 [Asimina triloba]
MGGKKNKVESAESPAPIAEGEQNASKKRKLLPSLIRNKEKRSAVHAKVRHEKKVEKRKRIKLRDAAIEKAVELGEEPPAKKTPRTIENTREPDETVCRPDDEELFAGNDADEFSAVIKRDCTPKILITTCRFHSTRGPDFVAELLSVIPNAHYYKRGTYELKKIVEYAINKEFTSIIVVHTNRREPVIRSPTRRAQVPPRTCPPPTLIHASMNPHNAHTDNHGNPTGHKPELVLNNFTTRLGHRIGRLIQSLFPQDPEFRGRRVVTFHNQRDFVFFRHHRYIFETKESKKVDTKSKTKESKKGAKNKASESNGISQGNVIARLQECGPRFTLKLISLQHGTFDTKGGEFEWVHKADMDTSRRRFFL